MKGMRALTDDEYGLICDRLSSGIHGARDVALIILGRQTGFRISELLSIRIRHLIQEGRMVDSLRVAKRYMKKKRETRTVDLLPATQLALRDCLAYLKARGFMQGEDFVFQSRTGHNAPISRTRAYRIIHNTARSCGITGPIGTHSMRKTYGQKLYNRFLQRRAGGEAIDPLRRVKERLGHKSISSTESYLEEDTDGAREDLLEVFG